MLSPAAYNGKMELAILCPITRQVKGYPFEVEMPSMSAVRGVILADRAKNLDWRARGAEFAERLPGGTVSEVLQKLNTLLSETSF